MTDRINQLKKILEADPDDPFCLYGIAFEYHKQRDFETAVQYYDRALRADPDYLYAYYHKAKALEMMGELDTARSTLVEGLARAEKLQDKKATSELTDFLDSLKGD